MLIVKLIPFFSKQPDNAKEILSTQLEEIDSDKEEIITFFDGSAIQNLPNTSKTLYKKGTKNKIIKNPLKFKVNALGSLSINGNSTLTITNSSKAHDISKAIIEIRIANTRNINLKNTLKEIIKTSKLSEKDIKLKITQNNTTKEDFLRKLSKNTDNKELTLTELAKKIEKQCKKVSLENTRRIDSIKRNTLFDNINKEQIKEYSYKEPKIHIILDNYSVHKSQIVKNISEILNINLIYLPPYSPNLNPIEQVWRTCKNRINKKYYESKEKLEQYFIKTYENVVIEGNFTKEWKETFLKKVT